MGFQDNGGGIGCIFPPKGRDLVQSWIILGLCFIFGEVRSVKMKTDLAMHVALMTRVALTLVLNTMKGHQEKKRQNHEGSPECAGFGFDLEAWVFHGCIARVMDPIFSKGYRIR